MKRILFLLAVVPILIVGFVAVFYPSALSSLPFWPSDAISAKAPRDMDDRVLKDVAHYRQDASEWGDETLGQTTDSLAGYGCTITSVANAISNMDKTPTTPKALNDALSDKGGYTSRGWLIWGKIADATKGQYRAEVQAKPSHAGIEACLKDGAYPIVKIMLGGVVPHWVLLTGRQEGEYLTRDPLKGDGSSDPIALSTRSSKIHSVRCIHPNT